MRKQLFIFGSILLLIGLVSGAMIQSYNQTAYVTTSGQPEDPLEAWSESDVIVWQYNSTFYASRNMSTNMVMTLSSNWTAVMQVAVDAIGANGGTIFLRVGTYSQVKNEFVSVKAGYKITVMGEDNQGTKIVKATGGTAGTDCVFKGTADASNAPYLTVKNIMFDCTVFGGAAVIGKYFTLLDCENLWAYGSDIAGTVFISPDGNMIVRNCHIEDFRYSTWNYYYSYSVIEGNYIENCGTVALGTGKYPNENATIIIRGNTVVDSGWEDEGVVIDGGWNLSVTKVNGLISNNVIINPTNGKGNKNGNIAVIAVSGVTIENNVINDIGTVSDASRTSGIKISGSVTYPMSNITIRNNEIHSGNRGIFIKDAFGDIVTNDNTITMEAQGALRGIYFTCDTDCPIDGENYLVGNTIRVMSNGTTTSHGMSFEIVADGAGTTTFYVYRNVIDNIIGATPKGIYFNLANTDATAYVKDNNIVSTTPIAPTGTVISLNSFTVPVVEGTNAPTLTAPYGFLINATNEVAFSFAVTPRQLLQLVECRIFAVANISETHSMSLSIAISSAVDNTTYNTGLYSSAIANSTTTNFAQYSVIYWTASLAGTIVTEETQMIFRLKYVGAADDNCATDAFFTAIEIIFY